MQSGTFLLISIPIHILDILLLAFYRQNLSQTFKNFCFRFGYPGNCFYLICDSFSFSRRPHYRSTNRCYDCRRFVSSRTSHGGRTRVTSPLACTIRNPFRFPEIGEREIEPVCLDRS